MMDCQFVAELVVLVAAAPYLNSLVLPLLHIRKIFMFFGSSHNPDLVLADLRFCALFCTDWSRAHAQIWGQNQRASSSHCTKWRG